MSDSDMLNQAERLLGRFDFAAQLAAKEEAHREQLRALLLSFVEVRDSFDRLFSALAETDEALSEDARSCLKTCRLIARQLDQALLIAGVKPTPALGQQAEPGRHEIVDVADVSESEEGVIVREIFRGYEWEGESLRKPQVIIARGADQSIKEE